MTKGKKYARDIAIIYNSYNSYTIDKKDFLQTFEQ